MDKKQKNRKKRIVIGLIIGVLAAIVIISMLGGYRFIKVKSYEGDVELERVTEEKKIFKGMMLKDNDKVTTGDDGLIELLVDKDKHILAQENTCFKIVSKGSKNKGKLQIKLRYGTALIEIENKLPEGLDVEVETSNAMLSVRGTIFETTYVEEENKTIVKVMEGVVKVTSETDSQKVEEGYMAIVEDDVIVIMELQEEEEDSDENNGILDMFSPDDRNGNSSYPPAGTVVNNDELPMLLRGGVTVEQLEYVLALAYECSGRDSVNHVQMFVANLWFDEECPGIEEKRVNGLRSYDVNALNAVLSVMAEATITENDVSTQYGTQYGYLSGDKLILYDCDVTKGDYYYTVIGDISYAEAGDIVVYYTFHFKNSGSLSGCDGIAEAYFMQDSEGKYYLYNVDIVTEVPYSID